MLLAGLRSRPDLNGRLGHIARPADAEGGRLAVRLEGRKEPLLLQPSNLSPLPCEALGLSLAGLRAYVVEAGAHECGS